MFKELYPIIAAGTNLCIMISGAADGEMTVTVLPQTNGVQSALSTPLSVTATPDELDAELPEALTSYVGHRATLAETLDNVKIIMEAAGKTARDEATKVAAKRTTGAVEAVDGDEEHEEDELEGGEARPSAPARTTVRSTVSKAPVVKPKSDTSDLDLF